MNWLSKFFVCSRILHRFLQDFQISVVLRISQLVTKEFCYGGCSIVDKLLCYHASDLGSISSLRSYQNISLPPCAARPTQLSICPANQLTGFYMMEPLVVKVLMKKPGFIKAAEQYICTQHQHQVVTFSGNFENSLSVYP